MTASNTVVNDIDPVVQYTATSGQTIFDAPWLFFDDDDLTVYQTLSGATADDTTDLLVLTTDYTVTNTDTESGGTIVLKSGAATGDTITIYRIVSLDRLADYQSSGDMFAVTLNKEQDTEMMALQQFRADFNRSISLKRSEDASINPTLPPAVPNKVFGWDSTGKALMNYNLNDGTDDADNTNYTPPGTGSQNRNVGNKLNEFVSVTDFGADPTGTSDSTTAIVAAIAAHDVLFFPEGNYLITPIIFGSTFKMMFGHNATITASGTIATDAQLLSFVGCSDLIVRDINIDVDHTTYPTVVNLTLSGCTDSLASKVHCTDTGKIGFQLANCNNTTLEKSVVADWQTFGILVTGASSRDNLIINNNITDPGASSTHAIQCTLGTNETVAHNYIEEAGIFGISLYKVYRSEAINNSVVNTTKEAINLHEASNCEARGNSCTWTGSQSEDFGMSIYTPTGDPIYSTGAIISNNKIQNAGKSGIGIAEDVNYSLITNNVIINCNLLNTAEEHGGICLYGAGCINNTVSNNVILDTGSNHKYGVFEWTNNGTPSLSNIRNNDITGFTVEEVKIIDAGSKTDAWRDFTSTITAQTGTITTSAGSGIYRVLDNGSCEVYITATITTNGTGAGYLIASLPYTVKSGFTHHILPGREKSISGDMLVGSVSGIYANIRTYDNQYPAVDGASVELSGTYAI